MATIRASVTVPAGQVTYDKFVTMSTKTRTELQAYFCTSLSKVMINEEQLQTDVCDNYAPCPSVGTNKQTGRQTDRRVQHGTETGIELMKNELKLLCAAAAKCESCNQFPLVATIH